MNLLGAIKNYCENHDDAATLRSLLGGTGKIWAGETTPEDLPMPYVRVDEISTVPLSQGKDNSWRIDSAAIQFDVVAHGRETIDAILDALEFALVDCQPTLNITNRYHLATYMTQRINNEQLDADLGILELEFRTQKQ